MFESLVKQMVARPVVGFAPPPEEIAPGIFGLDRQMRFPAGLRLPSRTTIVRLTEGSLVVISAPPLLGPQDGPAIEALGPVGRVIVPSSFHYVFAAAFRERFPDTDLFVPPGFFERIGAPPTGTELTRDPPLGWPREIEYRILQADELVAEIAFFHPATATLILTDLAFNITAFPRAIDAPLWRLSGVPAGFGPAGTSRRLLLRDRAVAGPFLHEVLAWPFERIVPAHGDVVERDARAVFERAFAPYTT